MAESGPGFKRHPDHKIEIEDAGHPVIVRVGEEEIARSGKAKILKEASYPPVYYIPLEDMPQSLLGDSEHSTYCPFKGTARYWDLMTGNGMLDNAVWGYEQPYQEVSAITGHVAFYPDRVIVEPCEQVG